MARGFASGRAQSVGRTQRVDPQLGGGGGEPPPDTAATITSGPTLVTKSSTTVTLTWAADQFVKSWLQYGQTTSYGSESTHQDDFQFSTHTQTVSGLSANTLYHFRPVVENQYGQVTIGSDIAVTTDAATQTSAYYGTAFADDALQNLNVGQLGYRYGFRFAAEQSSPLTSIRIYTIGPNYSGYAAGDGGLIRTTLHAVDGDNKPAAILATADNYTVTGEGDPGQVVTFPSPATLSLGTRYVLVFTNIHGSPTSNYSAIDTAQYFLDPNGWSQVQPRWSDLDFRTLSSQNGGAWVDEDQYSTPILDITYGNGQHQGQIYMESLDGPYNVNGTARIREVFTVSGGDKHVTGLWVRCGRNSGGSSALSCRLETSGGSALVTVTIPSTSWTSASQGDHNQGENWAFVSLGGTYTLTSGVTYNLLLSTSSGTTYWWVPLLKGTPWGYTTSLGFADGYAQFASTGSNWSSISGTRADLQFMFVTA